MAFPRDPGIPSQRVVLLGFRGINTFLVWVFGSLGFWFFGHFLDLMSLFCVCFLIGYHFFLTDLSRALWALYRG